MELDQRGTTTFQQSHSVCAGTTEIERKGVSSWKQSRTVTLGIESSTFQTLL